MKIATLGAVAIAALLFPSVLVCENAKSYKHASEYQIAILDQNLRVVTGSDVTLGKNMTDAKLGPGGQGVHLLHTDAGDYRVEAPVNTGFSILSAMASDRYHPAKTVHNQWFLDKVQPGTKVLFASECAKPNKKHPKDAVRCTFYFPDPDSTEHEYATMGDFTPFMTGDGSNTVKTAGTLCGTGKLKPEVEAELCAPQSATPDTGTAVMPATATPIIPVPTANMARPQVPPPAAAPVAAAPEPAAMAVAPARSLNPVAAQRLAPVATTVVAAPAPAALPVAMVVTPKIQAAAATPTSGAPVMASVAVESSVKGADIDVDGQFAGSTPSIITVSTGLHMIVVKKSGYAAWSRSLNVEANGVHVSADMGAQLRSTTRTTQKHTVPVRCFPASACVISDAGTPTGAAAN